MVHETSDTLQVQDRLELRIKVEKGDCYWVGGRSKLYPIRNPHSTGGRAHGKEDAFSWALGLGNSSCLKLRLLDKNSQVTCLWKVAGCLFPYISPIEQGIENIEIINHIELES